METNFFTSFLMGGLGNQMFQISHAYAQGLKHKTKVIFKPTAYTPMQANKPDKYFDNIYRKIKFDNFSCELHRVVGTWDFKEIIPPNGKNIEFYGYFQSSKNFYGFDDDIRNLFKPNVSFFEKISKKFPKLDFSNSVSLHIRRGDYLKIPKILPPLDVSYYENCINKIDYYENIFVFSDEISWAKQNLKFKNLIFVEGLEDYEELWMMSLCKINIMSNSTFSWWGSFLNSNKDKKVFVPNIWFGPNGEKNFNDLYESDWEKINVNFLNDKLICY
jgi:hypothetical protein